MRAFVLDLDTRAGASDITPRNRLAGRRDLDLNRPALCHIVIRGDAVIDRYGADLVPVITLNIRITRSLRCPIVAPINVVLDRHVGRSIFHRDVDAMRLPVIDALESLGRHVFELCARDGPACKRRARIVAHTLDIEQVVRVIGIGAGGIDRTHRAIRRVTINLVVTILDEIRPAMSVVVVDLNRETRRNLLTRPRVRTNCLTIDLGVFSAIIEFKRDPADIAQIKRLNLELASKR